MTLTSGARIGPYEIQSALGKGGMGEVYRALDTRLGRPVAIKVLTAHIESQPVGRLRFDQEALTVSSLSHPHICALYDIGEENGVRFLVMEYVEGETLASRLRRGAIPIDQVLRYAIEIADAIDHAHRRGFVHRDLKPSNIMLTRSGAKVLDFGIAKRCAPTVIENDQMGAQPPTTPLTADGTILGTLNYMAPEQLHGLDTDARADIFAFGAVVYEMATKRQAFEGPSRASVIAAILERDPPPIVALQPVAPPFLDHVIARCLAKDPDERWQTARDVKQELKWIAERGAAIGSAPASAVRDRRRRRTWLAAAALVGLATLVTLVPAIMASRRPSEDSRPYRFEILPPENATFTQSSAFMALSPDGHSLAFVASRQGTKPQTLWVQSFDPAAVRELPGTDGANQPFWSPDSRFLAFSAGGKLKKIDVSFGSLQTLADVPANNGDWSRDGVIVVSRADLDRNGETSLFRISASGSMTPVTVLDRARGETRHSWPHFLPDGRHFLYLAKSNQPENDNMVYVGSLDSNEPPTLLFRSDSQAVYVPPGDLLFLQGNSLVAQRFDVRSLRTTGEPVLIADGPIERTTGSGRGAFTVSPGSGVLAYRTPAETQLTWVARSGRPLGSIGAPALYGNPALSPDEQRVAVDRFDRATGRQDIWVIDVASGVPSPFTSEGLDTMPLWSADGSIVFRSGKSLKMKGSSGARGDDLLAERVYLGAPLAWLRNGSLLYDVLDPRTHMDVWILPVAGDRRPIPCLGTTFNESQGQLSPDERWVAYVSDESGRKEVWVRPFPSGPGQRKVSTNGGVEPRWRGNGKELFYLAPSDRGGSTTLMVVAMKADSTIEPGPPERLFETRMLANTGPGYTRNQYVVSGDGQRFLINQPPEGAPPTPITIMLNWSAALRQ